jgi:hypothetical protein
MARDCSEAFLQANRVLLYFNRIENPFLSLTMLLYRFACGLEIPTIERFERLEHVQEPVFNVHARAPKRAEVKAVEWPDFSLAGYTTIRESSRSSREYRSA